MLAATSCPSGSRRTSGRSAVALAVPGLLLVPALLSACAPPADTVSVSTAPSRANATALTGASLLGNAYVFVPKATGITAVSFFLDGTLRAHRVETAAPWDLGGTSTTGTALPFDTAKLTAGTHRVVAKISRGTATTSVTSTFTVKRPVTPVPAPPAPTQPPAPTPTSPVTSNFSISAGRPWSPTSPFNLPVKANPVLDPNSASITAYLSGGTRQQIASLYDYGWPVFNADAATPRVSVTSTMNWGTDPFAGLRVPIPTNLQANAGSDGHAAVIDWTTGRIYEFWQLKKVDATHWTTSWGQVTPNAFTGVGNERLGGGSSKGSGTSGLGGLVRTREMRAGVIDHALEFASNAVTPKAFRWPATKTDGTNMAGVPLSSTIPEGARLRLDPTIDLARIPGITKGELAVGRALQKYGAYCTDQGGARLSIGFEHPMGDPAGDPYPGVGFGWDYYHMSHIPWDKLQVLRSWDGS